MNLSQEAELGRSMLLSLPEELSNLLIKSYQDRLTDKKNGLFEAVMNMLRGKGAVRLGVKCGESVVKELDEVLQQYGCMGITTETFYGISHVGKAPVFFWFDALFRDETNSFWNPLDRVYFQIAVAKPDFQNLSRTFADRKVCSPVSVHWQTPHLAGLSKTHRDDLITEFSYNQDLRTYQLRAVREFTYEGDVPKLGTLAPYELVEFFLLEFFRKERTVKDEGGRFLEFVEHLSRSKEKSQEKYSRWSKALLKAFADGNTSK